MKVVIFTTLSGENYASSSCALEHDIAKLYVQTGGFQYTYWLHLPMLDCCENSLAEIVSAAHSPLY